jgi:photoactive yellow protein
MLSFDARDLARQVEALGEAEIDALPFGAIRLDEKGAVTFFSKAERDLSGYGARPTVGKIFFTDIAPCMADAGFRGRLEAARDRGTLDIAFSWTGDFADRRREMRVRIQSASDGGVWIFMQRPASKPA